MAWIVEDLLRDQGTKQVVGQKRMRIDQAAAAPRTNILNEDIFQKLRLPFPGRSDDIEMPRPFFGRQAHPRSPWEVSYSPQNDTSTMVTTINKRHIPHREMSISKPIKADQVRDWEGHAFLEDPQMRARCGFQSQAVVPL